ncbi:hypothetical protein VFPPC_09449 [Pochonia chlamydosporia 170]|uniref:Uncharacterized protein n=1 Tax=Pochonia chlamydosporia 170 TaxID=1380566 RepID=A0A179F881_METCM|nr:hypothetical protein VFPPC_09449 [Pochonia chlamydosporia 170]OAQ61636.1 hypothetical protein VFPPC_09449 [Pochonia chlamydosporia 170]
MTPQQDTVLSTAVHLMSRTRDQPSLIDTGPAPTYWQWNQGHAKANCFLETDSTQLDIQIFWTPMQRKILPSSTLMPGSSFSSIDSSRRRRSQLSRYPYNLYDGNILTQAEGTKQGAQAEWSMPVEIRVSLPKICRAPFPVRPVTQLGQGHGIYLGSSVSGIVGQVGLVQLSPAKLLLA